MKDNHIKKHAASSSFVLLRKQIKNKKAEIPAKRFRMLHRDFLIYPIHASSADAT